MNAITDVKNAQPESAVFVKLLLVNQILSGAAVCIQLEEHNYLYGY